MSLQIANKMKINLCLVLIKILYCSHNSVCHCSQFDVNNIDCFVYYSSVYTLCINNNKYYERNYINLSIYLSPLQRILLAYNQRTFFPKITYSYATLVFLDEYLSFFSRTIRMLNSIRVVMLSYENGIKYRKIITGIRK